MTDANRLYVIQMQIDAGLLFKQTHAPACSSPLCLFRPSVTSILRLIVEPTLMAKEECPALAHQHADDSVGRTHLSFTLHQICLTTARDIIQTSWCNVQSGQQLRLTSVQLTCREHKAASQTTTCADPVQPQ